MSNEQKELTTEHFEQLVVLQLANEMFGVDIAAVNAIIRMQEVTKIPRTPEFVEGVINLRGSIIPVIDLRKRFSLPVGDMTKTSRIVVVEASGQMIGMIVDAVEETMHLSSESVEVASPVVSSVDTEFIKGIGKHDDKLIILLDLDKVLRMNEIDSLTDLSSSADSLKSHRAA